VLINPYVRDPRLAVTPVARFLLPSVKGIGNDIKKPGQDELCNDRLSLGPLASMSAFHRKVRRELPSVHAPLLVFSAADDHTVKPANSSLVMERVGSERKELVRLTNSYHVATLDYDADLICERTLDLRKARGRDGGDAGTRKETLGLARAGLGLRGHRGACRPPDVARLVPSHRPSDDPGRDERDEEREGNRAQA